jgi:hypothetical protein
MDLRSYMKSIGPLKMLELAFNDHFGHNKLISKNKYSLKNNITIELQLNSTDPSIVMNDNSTKQSIVYLFDPIIGFTTSPVVMINRLGENLSFDKIFDDINMYQLFEMVEDKKEEVESE